jgi:PAS domain S-box-containing protein
MTVTNDLLDALPVAVYLTDAAGRLTYYNDAAAQLWGHRPQLGDAQWCGSWKLFYLDGRPMRHNECPMAQTLKTGRPVRGAVAIAERPDGSRVVFQPYPTPLRDSSGLTGAINLLMDVTESYQTELELAKLAAIVVSSDDAIVSKTLDGVITSWNEGARRIFGYEPEEIIGQHITKLIPPELHAEEDQILAQLRLGERVDHFETVRIAKDGSRIDISLSVSPLRDKTGTVIGAAKVARNVTERKRAEKLQHLLVQELNHRVKNTLATVQAIASQSAARAGSPQDFVTGFSGRLQAMARAHTLLSRNNFEQAEIADIVRDQVLLGPDSHRISFSGPGLLLDPQSALHLSLVLHELATNARKYGALAADTGRLSITWELRTHERTVLVLRWHESGSRKVQAPAESGFGTILIEQSLRARDGSASFAYGADGLSCELQLPLPEEWHAERAGNQTARSSEWKTVISHIRPKPLQGWRVAVVEDEPLILMDIEASLADAGVDVVGTAGNLSSAKHLLEGVTCDAALLDTNLSGERVDELAALLTRRNIPFAFITGYGREGLPEGFREGLLLTKPFSQEQLRAMLELLLYQRQKLAQIPSRRA